MFLSVRLHHYHKTDAVLARARGVVEYSKATVSAKSGLIWSLDNTSGKDEDGRRVVCFPGELEHTSVMDIPVVPGLKCQDM